MTDATSHSVPAVRVPAVGTPAVSVPAVSVPAVSVPAVSVPAVSVPAIGTPSPVFTVEGPVLAEILVLALDGDGGIRLTGPCGAAPWLVEVAGDPTDAVARLTRSNLGEPLVVHSTSWRQDRNAVVLTFVAVMVPNAVAGLESAIVDRSELARGSAAAAPTHIESAEVVEHALRHLAWLVRDDEVVADRLGPGWHTALEAYVPEPFHALG